MGLGYQPSPKTSNLEFVSCLQDVLGLDASTIFIRDARDSIHQWMGADAQSLMQIFGRAWEVLGGEEEEGMEKPERSGTPQEHGTVNEESGTKVGSQKSGSLCGSHLGPLHISYGCLTWCSCGIPKSGIMVCL